MGTIGDRIGKDDAKVVDLPRRCYEKGCASSDLLGCEFVDRHGRRCLSTWCSDHRTAVGTKQYCRRHAGVVRALGDGSVDLPELENRAPSLVNWIAEGIDAEVRAVLEETPAAQPGRHLGVELVHLVAGLRTRRWARSWCVLDADGQPTMRVSIEVDEHSDPEVTVRIDGEVIVRSIAPWIGHRLRRDWVPLEIADVERDAYYADLVAIIRSTIAEADSAR